MKLKAIALTVMLLASGGASATPTLQRCSPMEVVHNGSAGLAYVMACAAGDWNLRYSGSIPPGTEAVTAQYRLLVTNGDGSKFTHSRSVRLPSPAALGQALLREAVQLASGDLALRDCPDFGCTLYRPLGGAEQMAKATITVTPELKRLADEAARLTAELNARQAALAAQGELAKGLEAEVQSLKTALNEAQARHAAAEAARGQALVSLQEQHGADVKGLLAAAQAEKAKAEQAQAARAAREAELTNQLAEVTARLASAVASQATMTLAQESLRAAEAVSSERASALAALQAELTRVKLELSQQSSAYAAKLAEMKANAEKTESTATSQAEKQVEELVLARKQVVALAEQVRELQDRLQQASVELSKAREAQSAKEASAAERTAKPQEDLSAALKEARATITRLHAAQWVESHVKARLLAQLESLQAKQQKLVNPPVWGKTSRVRKLNQALRGELAASRAEIARLSTQLATIEVGAAPAAEVQALRDELVKVTQSRDAAVAQYDSLAQQTLAASADYEKMAAGRIEAYKGAQQVAKDMLELLDQFQALEAAKQDADAALTSSTHRVMELTAKLQAAGMARDLAMQAADAAHADADAQHLKTLAAVARAEKAEQQLAAAGAQRDSVVTKLKAVQQELAEANRAQGTETSEVKNLQDKLQQLTLDRDQLRADLQSRSERVQFLELLTMQQNEELEALRKEVMELKAAKVTR